MLPPQLLPPPLTFPFPLSDYRRGSSLCLHLLNVLEWARDEAGRAEAGGALPPLLASLPSLVEEVGVRTSKLLSLVRSTYRTVRSI